jgi:putative flavoprotein involved in K+ transport
MRAQSISANREATKGFLEEGTALARLEKRKVGPLTPADQSNPRQTGSFDVVVIGGSQAGLSVGYYLERLGVSFVILDAYPRVGDPWRRRWDSLRLFTPGRYDGLPGMPFPGPAGSYPGKDEMADYLESYAIRFELPVWTGVRVERVGRMDGRFEIMHRDGRLHAKNVVVATGAYHQPRIPSFATLLDGGIRQMHSSDYQRPSQLKEGDVLVVGAGNSGAEIAIELAREHHVWLSGPDTGQEPTRAGSLPDRLFTPIMWFLATEVFKVTTPVGRNVRDHFLRPPRGIPLGRVRRRDIINSGIERVTRTVGVRDGSPELDDGRVLKVSNVIWCTGFVTDFTWIDFRIFDAYGYPDHHRGIAESVPGLYFVGLPFQYSLSSTLVGGVGRDAAYVVAHLERGTAINSRARSR